MNTQINEQRALDLLSGVTGRSFCRTNDGEVVDVDDALEAIRQALAQQVPADGEWRGLLEVAVCPNEDCVDGRYYGQNGEPMQCQWCYERKQALSATNRTAPVGPSWFHLRERYFWQSRAMLRDPPQLTDLHSLAQTIRKTHPRKQA